MQLSIGVAFSATAFAARSNDRRGQPATSSFLVATLLSVFLGQDVTCH
jgi:hypothetical protein